jgi:hypothetical protein
MEHIDQDSQSSGHLKARSEQQDPPQSSRETVDLTYQILPDGSYEFRGYQFSKDEVLNFSRVT